jgi:hypothetical protein
MMTLRSRSLSSGLVLQGLALAASFALTGNVSAASLAPSRVESFFIAANESSEEGDTGVGYLTSRSIILADGKWHTSFVRFDELSLSGANRPDPNSRLDLDQVDRISVGLNSESKENRLDVSDLYVH